MFTILVILNPILRLLQYNTVTITTTKKTYDKYRLCDERIQRLESTIARFVKGLKSHTLTDVAGEVFDGCGAIGSVRQFE